MRASRPETGGSVRGDAASRIAAEWSARTHEFRAAKVLCPRPELSGHYAQILPIGRERIVLTADGIGTKIEVAERLGRYDTLGFDLVAMVTDDLAALGAEPAVLSNVLDVSVLDDAVVDELFRGLHAAARLAGVAVAGGEIAELGGRVAGHGSGMHFVWSATCVGSLPEGWAPVDGSAIEPGDAILAVREHGFRANGFSVLRRGLEAAFGSDWHVVPCDGGSWGEVLLTPSVVCSPLVVALRTAAIPLHGIAHITGGGIPSKLGRVLRATGHGATLSHLLPPPAPMQAFVRLTGMPIREAYETFHMGPAMLIVLPAADVERAIAVAAAAGARLEPAGAIESEPGIRIATAPGRFEQWPRASRSDP